MLPLEVIEFPDRGTMGNGATETLLAFSALAVASSQLDRFQLGTLVYGRYSTDDVQGCCNANFLPMSEQIFLNLLFWMQQKLSCFSVLGLRVRGLSTLRIGTNPQVTNVPSV